MSLGDMVQSLVNGGILDRAARGIFSPREAWTTYKFKHVTDGLSNTIALSERLCQQTTTVRGAAPVTVQGNQLEQVLGVHTRVAGLVNTPSLCYEVSDGRYFKAGSQIQARFGIAWQDGQPMYVAFNTVLPPNAPACADGGNNGDSRHLVIPPASRHSGGVNATYSDGSVHFVSNNIDTGNLNVRQTIDGPSEYGVWGALGSKSGGEAAVLPN